MKTSHLSIIEHTHTHGVLARIITDLRDGDAYFVTPIPATKDPQADSIMTMDKKYKTGVSFISLNALAIFSMYPE